jgi:hypothetical protein
MYAVDNRSHAIHYFRYKYKKEVVAMTISAYLAINKICGCFKYLGRAKE